MILRRIGNKAAIASTIHAHFPAHQVYIELFFGAGGMFLNKPRAKYNFLNDIDNDVFNLFMVLKEQPEKTVQSHRATSNSRNAFLTTGKKNEETDPIWKAVRFIFHSNFALMRKGTTLRYRSNANDKSFIHEIIETSKLFQDPVFMCTDFRKVLSRITFEHKNLKKDYDRTLIYADPPYLDTGNKYVNDSIWTEEDTYDLFEVLCNSKVKFAMSEFRHPFIVDQAKKRGLHIISIGERHNLKTRTEEILILNYQKPQLEIFPDLA